MLYLPQNSSHDRLEPALTHHCIYACAWASPSARPFRCQPLSCPTGRTSCALSTGSVCQRIGELVSYSWRSGSFIACESVSNTSSLKTEVWTTRSTYSDYPRMYLILILFSIAALMSSIAS